MSAPRRARLFDSTPPDGPSFAPDHPRVDDPAAVERIVAFLRGGTAIQRTTGLGADVVDATRGAAVPRIVYTDGAWIWTAGHIYYLEEYGLAPEVEFLAHMKAAGHRPSTPSESEVAAALDVIKGP